ncbi:efflux RND transporter periplasmic adaptor subunit [Fulvimonas yonginensis]|uniref:HlyD family efflux transporter periplasmic adaptor subunit n=1 Tax=Fulvimonas yonginensis TaxID=1495200 RepID=A0ABU8JC08_9GAMM
MMRRACLGLALAALCACSASPRAAYTVLEQAHAGPLEFEVRAEGELRAVTATPMLVPGEQWTPRQIVWMLPDGTRVTRGERVARFSATQSEQDLAQARIDLERNLLARAGKQDELATKQGQLGVDIVQVDGQLAIAHRYAHATLAAIARNDILDAVQDEAYLGVRRQILQWRERQSSARGKAELAVLDAQHDTYATVARQKQADLDALELRAPHDGVLVLERDWAGQEPHVGSNLWAGNSFASLPDLSALEVQLAVPQIEAQGIAVGQTVQLHPWGRPAQRVSARLDWIAAAAQTRDRESPVKYLSLKARVPADAVRRFGWVPGQRFVGDIVLLDARRAMSVPNVALVGNGDGATVRVLSHGAEVVRKLRLGVRGATRTQVLDGLQEGDRILLAAAPDGDGT